MTDDQIKRISTQAEATMRLTDLVDAMTVIAARMSRTTLSSLAEGDVIAGRKNLKVDLGLLEKQRRELDQIISKLKNVIETIK